MKSLLPFPIGRGGAFAALLFFSVTVCTQCQDPDQKTYILKQAHAHNDYEHQRPLLDALAYGFISIEADIHLMNDNLLVAHDSVDIRTDRTLQRLYLEPLKKRIQKNGGTVYNNKHRLVLLIDIKTGSIETYQKLHDLLHRYADILTIFENHAERPGPVLVIISGNRPLEFMKGQRIRYAAIDGRFENLDLQEDAFLFPLISEDWKENFSWNGEGLMPANEELKLMELINQVHAKGQRLRFWGTPDSVSFEREQVWTKLLALGVDLIGSDDLSGLSSFFSKRENQ